MALARRAILTGLSLAEVACGAGWHRLPEPPPAVLKPRQQVQMWREGEKLELHGVTIDSTRVTGIPYWKPLDCDSCRVEVPSAEVDSLRVGSPTGGFWRSVAAVMIGAVVGLMVLCALDKGCQLGSD